jgi:short-subunit dehydrogenase
MSPEGRHALVTGGNGGIGRLVVEQLAARGARITIADLYADGTHPDASYIAVDLSKVDSVFALGESFRASPPDILVNLAGLNAFGSFEKIARERLSSLMQVNLMASMQLVHALLPTMLVRGSGQIVNVGSVLADIALPYFAAYSASKAGIAKFSEALRRELAGRGITVTYIAPRAVKTAMNAGTISEYNRRTGAHEDPPEKVAHIIVDAICRDLPRVSIGYPEKLFTRINALAPALVDRSLIRNRHVAEDVLSAETLLTR